MRPSAKRLGGSEEYVALSQEKQQLLNNLGRMYDDQVDLFWKEFERAVTRRGWAQALVSAEKLQRIENNKKGMRDLIDLYFDLQDPDQEIEVPFVEPVEATEI